MGEDVEDEVRVRDQESRRQRITEYMVRERNGIIDGIDGIASLGWIQGLAGSIGVWRSHAAFLGACILYIEQQRHH